MASGVFYECIDGLVGDHENLEDIKNIIGLEIDMLSKNASMYKVSVERSAKTIRRLKKEIADLKDDNVQLLGENAMFVGFLNVQDDKIGELQKVKEEHDSDTSMYVSCGLRLEGEQFVEYTSGCDGECGNPCVTYCIMRKQHIMDMQLRSEIANKKTAGHNKSLDSLRTLNAGLVDRIGDMKKSHAAEIKKMDNDMRKVQYKHRESKRQLEAYRRDFRSHVDTRVEEKKLKLNISASKKMSRLNVLMDIYEKHGQDAHILYQHAIIENFINSTCEKRTGRKRNYRMGVYNNIYDFMRLPKINTYMVKHMGMTVSKFNTIWSKFKAQRNKIAHPATGVNSITTIRNTIKNICSEFDTIETSS